MNKKSMFFHIFKKLLLENGSIDTKKMVKNLKQFIDSSIRYFAKLQMLYFLCSYLNKKTKLL